MSDEIRWGMDPAKGGDHSGPFVKPALTAEEWWYVMKRGPTVYNPQDIRLTSDGYGQYPDGYKVNESARHGVAAACLHGQPFGFTRQDVELLRELKVYRHGEKEVEDLANRIEALLPPEED